MSNEEEENKIKPDSAETESADSPEPEASEKPVESTETDKTAETDTTAAEAPAAPEELDKTAETEENAEAESADKPEVEPEETVETVDDGKSAADKADSGKKAKRSEKPTEKHGKGMSKLFKLIYYPVVAVVALIMLVFSFVDGVAGYKPAAYDGAFYDAANKTAKTLAEFSRSDMSASGVESARNSIVGELEKGGFIRAEEIKSGDEDDTDPVYTVTNWAEKAGAPAPTVTLFTSKLTSEIQTELGFSEYLVGKQLTDIVAAIPSAKTASGESSSSVVITVRYDTRADSPEATNAAFIAYLVQSLCRYVKDGASFDNDVVVVFTEDLGNAYGSYAFFNSFHGFKNVVDNAIAGLNLEAYGNSGTLALTDASRAGLDYLNAYTGISGTAFNASVVPDSIPSEMKNTAALDAFGSIPVIQVAVVGRLDYAQSAADTFDALPETTIYEQASFIKKYIDKFGSVSADYGTDGADNAFFSYFDWGTVAYTKVAAYVIGGLLIALVAAVIVMTVLKKTFSLSRMLKSLGMQAAVVLCSLVAMYAAYFLITLMLTGFGVIPIHAITQVRYFNAGILIAAMFVALSAAFGFTVLFKKLFKVTSSDATRGTALMFALVGIIMSFAAPAYSYLTVWLGMLSAAVLLVTVCLNTKFKDRFGFGMDRLFIYVLPVILCMPFMLSAISSLGGLLPLIMLPLVMTLFVGMLGVCVPYLDRTAVIFDKVAKKLPARTLRVERTVTEKVEDRAKKGKFTERTVKRVDKEKIPVNYKNYFGISLLAVVGCVVALFSGGFGATFGRTITTPYTYAESIYNDSIVYEWDMTGSSVKQQIIVDDLVAYKYVRYAVSGLQWDAVNERYYKTIDYKVQDIEDNKPNIKKGDNNVYDVMTFDGPRSAVKLTIPSAKNIKKIMITKLGESGVSYTYEFNQKSEIVLQLPYGFGNFSVSFDGGNPSTIHYEERSAVTASSSYNPLANVDEWNRILQYYAGTDLYNDLRGGIVLKRTLTF